MPEIPDTRIVKPEVDPAAQSASTVPDPANDFGQTLQTRSGLDDPGGALDVGSNPSGPASSGRTLGPPQGFAGRHELFGEIGRGGMGSVLRGRDPDLKRDLAVKVLRDNHKNNADSIRRFTEEAQITGQLQHPGIVPIHELGRFDDGRPYFTMKLVKGHTLSELLAARPSPATDLTRFLSIFLRVCQTLAYAHSRKVIHRDLKPANIMVGAFGEVQVMDWGLAKVITPATRHAPAPHVDPTVSVIRTVRTDSEADESCDGSVIGTPAYMPPEQAMGEVDRVDERADVFGLGAILCEILTGRPPYAGRNGSEVLRMAARADLSHALTAIAGCGADAELAALARECLAEEPEDRPRHAGIVAERLLAHLAGVQERLAAAERDRAAAEARADAARHKAHAERKARQLTVWLAVAALGAASLGGVRYYNWSHHRAKVEYDVNDALGDAGTALTRANWPESRANLERAEGALAAGGGFADLHSRLDTMRADLDMGVRLGEVRLEKVNPNAEGAFDLERADRAYAQAFHDYGLDVFELSPEAAAAQIRAAAIHDEIIAALDDWSLSIRNDEAKLQRLTEVANLADTREFRKEVRQTILSRDAAAIEKLAARPEIADLRPTAVRLLGRALVRSKGNAFAVEFFRAARQRKPNEFWLNLALGWALSRGTPAQVEEAGTYFAIAGALQPNKSVTLLFQANYLNDQGRLEEAKTAYGAALALQKDLAQAHFGLGQCLANQDQPLEALNSFREALRLKPDALFYCTLGNLLAAQGQYAEAAEALRHGDELGRKLAAGWTHPSAQWLRDAERMAALAKDFPAYLRGEAMPADANDRVLLGRMCLSPKKLYQAAARFFAAAFAAKPSLTGDAEASHRFDAARAAVLAAAGQGNDAAALPPDEQARLRQEALVWLKADLALWSKTAASAKDADRVAAYRAMKRWRTHPDFTGVRAETALAKLPLEERHAWREFWAGTDAVREKAEKGGN